MLQPLHHFVCTVFFLFVINARCLFLFYFHYHFPQCFVSRYVFGSEICLDRLQGHVLLVLVSHYT